jgi:hypothetical protein
MRQFLLALPVLCLCAGLATAQCPGGFCPQQQYQYTPYYGGGCTGSYGGYVYGQNPYSYAPPQMPFVTEGPFYPSRSPYYAPPEPFRYRQPQEYNFAYERRGFFGRPREVVRFYVRQ